MSRGGCELRFSLALGREPVQRPATTKSRSNSSSNNYANRSFPPEEMHGQEWLCHEMPGWRSAEILLSQRSGDEPPQLCPIIPPGKIWPARIADQSAVRAGAGSTD